MTYVSGEPDVSRPFGQRDLALSDDPQGEREDDIFVFLLSLVFVIQLVRRALSRRPKVNYLTGHQPG